MNIVKPLIVWTLLGLVGIVTLALSLDLSIITSLPDAPDLAEPLLRLIVVVQPTALLAGAVVAGVMLSGPVGLTSWLTDRLQGKNTRFPSPILPLAGGVLAGFAVALVDIGLFGGFTDGPAAQKSLPGIGAMFSALTYGGITEELLLRYGLMTLLFWGAFKLFKAPVPHWAAWAIIGVVALLFGAGHLPAMAALTPLTPLIILRTIGLNAALALFYGWLYWRRGLEAGMMAHMATHPGMWLGLALTTA